MAPKQKTFELIPDPVGLPGPAQQAGAVINMPPMTTKQAKKLYRQKNKGPKLSKAEQRRIELLEQDRIRKEFEKEKAQARARTARERKKEKEDKEKEGRRRKGLPLVDVHPSQGTISNFISRLAFGKKNALIGGLSNLEAVQKTVSETGTEADSDSDTLGGDVYEENGEEEASDKENQKPGDDAGDRPPKKRRLTEPNGKLLDRMIHIPSQQRSLGAMARVAQELDIESRLRASSVDTDDPATETMLEDQIIADVELASSKSMVNSSPIEDDRVKEVASINAATPKPVSAVAAVPTVSQRRRPLPPRPPPGQQGRQPPTSPTRNDVQKFKTAVSNHVRAHQGEAIYKKPISPFIPRPQEKPVFRSPAIDVPSAPPKFKARAEPQTSKFVRPKFLPRHVQAPTAIAVQASPTYAGSRRPVTEAVDALPMSTQLFVQNYADELFPSASQEAQELLEDHHPAAKARVTAKPSTLAGQSTEPPSRLMATPEPRTTFWPTMPLQKNQPPAAGGAPLEFPFLSTQDFVLSSQDMMELETPGRVREDLKPQTTRPIARRDTLPMEFHEGRDPGKQRAPELQAPAGSKASDLPRSTNSRAHLGPDTLSSTSGSGSRTFIQKTEHVSQAKKAICCPSKAHNSPRSQSLETSSIHLPSYQPASRTTSSPRESRDEASPGDQSHGLRQGSRQAPCSCHSPVHAKPSQENALSKIKDADNREQDRIVTPQASPPKKRMFGSSGPGAEVLVAMERSLQEERRREKELQAQLRSIEASRQREEEQLARELADLIDDDDELSDGSIREGTKPCQPTSAGAVAAKDPHPASSGNAGDKTEMPASQETDYGDFDFEAGEELGILTDMAWIDDDLEEF